MNRPYLYARSARIAGAALFALSLAWTALAQERAGGFVQAAKIEASNAGDASDFGSVVAAEGNTAITSDTFAGANTEGSVHVYTFSNGSWVETAKLVASDPQLLPLFGESVAMSGDTVLVGAPWWSADATGDFDGAAYVYRRTNAGWVEEAKIALPNPADSFLFGNRVALDGNRAAILEQNALYIYERTGSEWTMTAMLGVPPVVGWFYESVALLGDTVVVGREESLVGGAARIHRLNGSVWEFVQDFVTDVQGFGGASALSADGRLAIGAHWDSKAFVYLRGSDGKYQEEAMLEGAPDSVNDHMGFSVAISGDTLIAGARLGGVIDSGKAYVFTRRQTGWISSGTLRPGDPLPSGAFGTAVALSGNRLVVGSPQNSSLPLTPRIYVFERNQAR